MDPNMLRVNQLLEAVAEANRFVRKAKAALKVANMGIDIGTYSPEMAAVKRASLDLTFALVPLRKSVCPLFPFPEDEGDER